MKRSFVFGVLGVLGSSVFANRAHARPLELVLRVDPLDRRCELVSFRSAQTHKDLVHQSVVETVTPVPAPLPGTSQTVVRLLSHDARALVAHAERHCANHLSLALPSPAAGRPSTQVPLSRDDVSEAHVLDVVIPPLYLVPLIASGPADNRVDLAFFADGYTAGERDKFLDDAARLARDLSTNHTFFAVRPLLNFWAVFTPSNESGVGVGGKAKDTAFGLYRDGTELRGLYANKSDVALAACASLGDKCNYAILLANDPLYGGIGGEYTTTTASLANGALVLRHEIGHSIIQVGEEYDGGFAYFGVNAVHDPDDVTWAHWLTHKDFSRVERSVMPMQAYPWTLLDVEKPWSITFSSSGTYARHLVKFSLSGIPHAEDLAVYLDGVDLEWTPREDIGIDRWHYDVFSEDALSAGEHVIEFSLRSAALQGRAQLCSAEVLEYGSPDQFNATRGHYSLFPTFDLANRTTYRPTRDDCLMRTVARPDFCHVCQEGLWRALLARVDLVDDLLVTCEDQHAVVELELVKLAQLREEPVDRVESYAIAWSKDGRVLEALANLTRVELRDLNGKYRVDVAYAVDEVRLDPRGHLHASRTFDVVHACSW